MGTLRAIPLVLAACLLATTAARAAAYRGHFNAQSVLARPDIRVLVKQDATENITLKVIVRERDPKGSAALGVLLHDPKSPLYRHFLTRQQYVDAFAPTANTYRSIVLQLQNLGYSVLTTDKERFYINVLAPLATIKRTLGTSIIFVTQKGHGLRHVQLTDEHIPVGLASGVIGFLNTTDVVLAKSLLENVKTAIPPVPQLVEPALRRGNALNGPTYGPTGGTGAPGVARSYQMPVQRGFNGGGRSIGFAIDVDYSQADLNTYMQYFQITRMQGYARIAVDGGGAAYNPNNPDEVEASLDSQTEAGLAPDSPVYEYLIPDLGWQHEYDAFEAAVKANTVDAFSASFGGCEDQAPSSVLNGFNQVFHQADLQGITVSASSGDQGVFGCPGNTHHVEAPASTPDITAVGGTAAGAYGSSAPYSTQSGWSGSGGGYSSIWTRPAFQNYLSFIPSRGMPDISFPADDVPIVVNGSWIQKAGTSWASPIFAAFQVTLNSQNNTRRGFADPAMYAANQKSGYTGNCLEDITTGNNGSPAAVGWDYVTGLGSFVQGCVF